MLCRRDSRVKFRMRRCPDHASAVDRRANDAPLTATVIRDQALRSHPSDKPATDDLYFSIVFRPFPTRQLLHVTFHMHRYLENGFTRFFGDIVEQITRVKAYQLFSLQHISSAQVHALRLHKACKTQDCLRATYLMDQLSSLLLIQPLQTPDTPHIPRRQALRHPCRRYTVQRHLT